MNKCCVCGMEFDRDEPLVLFTNKAGEDEIVCDYCSAQGETMINSDSLSECFSAAEYLRECADLCDSDEVSRYIKYILSLNGFESEKTHSIPIIASWLSSYVILGTGLGYVITGMRNGEFDLLTIILSVAAFVFIMMVCEIGRNIIEIKNILTKRNRKK